MHGNTEIHCVWNLDGAKRIDVIQKRVVDGVFKSQRWKRFVNTTTVINPTCLVFYAMLNIFSLIPDWVLVKMPRNNILLFLIDTAFLGLLLKSIGMITASFQGFLAYRHNPILNHIEQQRTSLLATISTISIVSSSMFKLVSSIT